MTAPATPTTPPRYRVAEIFGPTVQGEGALIGVPTFFVRFGGCDDRCAWCDSPHAVLPEHRPSWAVLGVEDIVARLTALGAQRRDWITLSGGNPALQPCGPLLAALHTAGLRVAMETQGTQVRHWMGALDHLCVSPKPPSSGNPTNLASVRAVLDLAPNDVLLKVVVFDDADLAYAKHVHETFPGTPFALSVGNAVIAPDERESVTRARLLDAYTTLVTRARALLPQARVLPQLHALAWGNRRGV